MIDWGYTPMHHSFGVMHWCILCGVTTIDYGEAMMHPSIGFTKGDDRSSFRMMHYSKAIIDH